MTRRKKLKAIKFKQQEIPKGKGTKLEKLSHPSDGILGSKRMTGLV